MSLYFNVPLEGHIRQAKDVFSDHLSYVTLFQCSIGRSRAPTTLKSEGEVTSLSGADKREVRDSREKW
jgi:hypothetical protein